MSEAYVSLVTNDSYANGAIVLGKSLRLTETNRKLVLMVTNEVSSVKRIELLKFWDEIIDINLMESNDTSNLLLLNRPELKCTFSKLQAWSLTQFNKCVFLDADIMVLHNVDDLFDYDEFSAAPDIGWPDCFNSGVFVFKPSKETYQNLKELGTNAGSFDGGDQGLLNEYFSDWSRKDIKFHLPFIYNMVVNVCYSYLPAFKRYGSNVKIVHFLGPLKPWHQALNYKDASENAPVLKENLQSHLGHNFNEKWWEIFLSSKVSSEASSTTSTVSTTSLDQLSSDKTWKDNTVDTADYRRQKWEAGNPDYTGKDKFENIIKRLNDVLLSKNTTPDDKNINNEEQ